VAAAAAAAATAAAAAAAAAVVQPPPLPPLLLLQPLQRAMQRALQRALRDSRRCNGRRCCSSCGCCSGCESCAVGQPGSRAGRASPRPHYALRTHHHASLLNSPINLNKAGKLRRGMALRTRAPHRSPCRCRPTVAGYSRPAVGVGSGGGGWRRQWAAGR
jgi:hypothetical protein